MMWSQELAENREEIKRSHVGELTWPRKLVRCENLSLQIRVRVSRKPSRPPRMSTRGRWRPTVHRRQTCPWHRSSRTRTLSSSPMRVRSCWCGAGGVDTSETDGNHSYVARTPNRLMRCPRMRRPHLRSKTNAPYESLSILRLSRRHTTHRGRTWRRTEDRGRIACNGVLDESYPVTCKTKEHPEEHFQSTVTLDKSSGKRMGWVAEEPRSCCRSCPRKGCSSAVTDCNNEHPDKAEQGDDISSSKQNRYRWRPHPWVKLTPCKRCLHAPRRVTSNSNA